MSLRGVGACLLLLIAFGGCGGSGGQTPAADANSTDGTLFSCATESRATPYAPGEMQTSKSGAFTAKLLSSDPPPPTKGNEAWTVQILDMTGAPVDGLSLKVVPYMPDHVHGTSVKPVVTPAGSGTYSITPLYLFMAGYWEVTVTIQPASGASDSVVFPVCIAG